MTTTAGLIRRFVHLQAPKTSTNGEQSKSVLPAKIFWKRTCNQLIHLFSTHYEREKNAKLKWRNKLMQVLSLYIFVQSTTACIVYAHVIWLRRRKQVMAENEVDVVHSAAYMKIRLKEAKAWFMLFWEATSEWYLRKGAYFFPFKDWFIFEW